jgi:hypothetical protein
MTNRILKNKEGKKKYDTRILRINGSATILVWNSTSQKHSLCPL